MVVEMVAMKVVKKVAMKEMMELKMAVESAV